MPLPVVLAVLVAAQTAILALPWIAVKVTFYSPPDPMTNPEHAATARSARWKLDVPLSIALVVVGALWIDHEYSAIIASYLTLITRFLVATAGLSRRSIPVLGLAFPWVAAPVLAWGAVLIIAALSEGGRSWLWAAGAAVLAFVVPPQLLDLVAMSLRAVLVTGKRLWLRRRLGGRWVRSAGGWAVVDVRGGGRDPESPHEPDVLLQFAHRRARFGWVLDPPRFLVEVRRDPEWRPPEEYPLSTLAGHLGPGPITSAFVAASPYGTRIAQARLDEELVVVVDERRIGGDDFYRFITSLVPTGRVGHPHP